MQSSPPANIKNRRTRIQYDAQVLIVDDNPVNLQVAEGMFEMFGCRVDTCLSGMEALEITIQKRYDLIALDIEMPDMDGFETATLLREFFKISKIDTPIVALTATISGPRDIIKCKEHGMVDILAKPLTSLMLEARLQAWQIRKIYHHTNESLKDSAGLF